MTLAQIPEHLVLLDNVVRKLKHVRPVAGTRDVFRADCPREHPHATALTVQSGADGRVILHCDGGCSTPDVALALKLTLTDLFPKKPEPARQPGTAAADDGDTLPAPVCMLNAPKRQPLVWGVENLWIAGELGLLVGDGGSFKSTASLQLAGAVAGGYPVWDHFSAPRKPVLIVSAEDSIDVVSMRLDAFITGHRWDRGRVLENVHTFALPDVSLSDLRWQAHLSSVAKTLGVGLIIFDPFAELIASDENSNTEVRPIVKYLRNLGVATGAMIGIVHHAGKAGQDKRRVDRIRGASALPSAARTIFFFEYSATGVTVEHLKMSRAPRLDTFVLHRAIESSPTNRAEWQSATLTFETAQEATLNRAESWILDQVRAQPKVLTSSALKQLLNGTGIQGRDFTAGLTRLHTLGRLGFEPGPKGSRLWYAVDSYADQRSRDAEEDVTDLQSAADDDEDRS